MSDFFKIRSAFLILFSANIGVQVFLFLGMLLLVRLYSPEAFGEYGFYAGVATAVTVISGGRFDYLAFVEGERCKSGVFYFLSLMVAGFICFFSFVFAKWLSGYWLERVYFEWWVLFFVASSAIFYLGTQCLISWADYSAFAKFRFFQILLQISMGVGLSYWMSGHGLSLAFAGSQLVLGLILFGGILWRCGIPRFSDLMSLLNEFKAKAFANSLISIMQYSAPFCPLFFGAVFYSKGEVGAYFVFSQIAAAPLSVLRRSLLSFLNAELNMVQKAIDLSRFLARVKPVFFIIPIVFICAVLMVLVLCRDDVVRLLLGNVWLAYSTLLVPLVIYYFFDAFLQPFTTLLPLWGFTRVSLVFEFLRFFLAYIGGGFLVVLGLGYYSFVLVFIVGMLFIYVVQVLCVIHVVRGKGNG